MSKGFERPCIFVSMNTNNMEGNVNVRRKRCFVEMIRFQEVPDEAEALQFFDTVEEAFYPKLQVKDRYLNTEEFSSDFIGAEENIPRIEFEFEYFEKVEKIETNKLMKEFRLKESAYGITEH